MPIEADITYGTNNEFGFRLPARQHGVSTGRTEFQRPNYAYAVVDEVDSILIDEARTPLIISGAVEKSAPSAIWRSMRWYPC